MSNKYQPTRPVPPMVKPGAIGITAGFAAAPKAVPAKPEAPLAVEQAADIAAAVDAVIAEPLPADMAQVLAHPATQAMLAKMVEESTARILTQIQAARVDQPAAAAPATADVGFAQQLALAIAQITDQGSRQKRVDPAELVRRDAARALMETLLIEARAKGDIPEYELIRAVYLDEVLVAPTFLNANKVQMRTRIAWPQVPNEHMQPTNAVARAVHAAFMESIGGVSLDPKIALAEEQAIVSATGLKILHRSDVHETPQVGRPRGGAGLQLLGRDMAGQIVETNVLGTVAAPARTRA